MQPREGRCITCGRELGVEAHFITTAPDGEHVRCRDWSRVPWPYDALTRRLRQRYRDLRRALAEVEALGRWLAERRRLWPEGAAETVMDVTARVERVRRLLDRAGWRGVRR